MGNFWSKLVCMLNSKEMRILMLGLDSAGKTTILYKLKLDQPYTNIPTVGFNVETVVFKNVKFGIWDVGGQDKIRPLWRHYYTGTQGLIYVIDSSDRERFGEALRALGDVTRDSAMKNVPVLIFANKQDMPNAITVEGIRQHLENFLNLNQPWTIQTTVATTGDGVYEGLSWLIQFINKVQ